MNNPQTHLEDAPHGWEQLKTCRDADLPLWSAALLIASDEYPGLDNQALGRTLDDWCADLRGRIGEPNTLQALQALNRFVFDEQGFAGDDDNYYDPRNSYLNEVMTRRLGNPISLAVVQLEMARRLGLPMQGVSFPGHFLLRFPLEDGLLILDPYHKGRSLDADELRLRASPHLPGQRIGDEQLGRLLEPAPNRLILMRMLRNLKQLYIERSDFERALRCTDRLLILDPRDADELRDRGKLYAHIGHRAAAIADFRKYLERRADADDAVQIRHWMIELGAAPQRLN